MKPISVFVALFLAGGLGASASEAPSAESVRQTIAEWVQTQRILSEEQSAWRQEEQVLQQSVELLEKEIEMLQARLNEIGAESDQAAEAKRSLGENNEAYLAATNEASEILAAIERELQALLPLLPPPVRAQAGPLFSRLDEAAIRTVALSQRLQTVLGILAEVNRFQRNVTLTREARELDDGTRREMRTVYLGLGHGFFVDDNGRVAGTGRPTASGWQWTRNDNIAPEVARAVAILQNQRTAEFVNLPVEVTK